MVLFYKKYKNSNEIQLTKYKIDLNNQKIKNHPPKNKNHPLGALNTDDKVHFQQEYGLRLIMQH